jgi:hypothetical protein
MIFLLFLTLLFTSNIRAQQTFFPSAIPLAVRSPYLNTWDYLTNGSIFGQTWPTAFNSKVPYAVPEYSADYEILIINMSDPRVVSPRACRRPNLFLPGR